MAFTLAQLQTELQARGYMSDTSAAQTAALNAGLRDVKNYRRWPWDEAELTAAVAADVQSFTPATPTLEPDDVRMVPTLAPTDPFNLNYLEPNDLRSLIYTDFAVGQPEFWSFWDGKIWLYPKTDAAYTAYVDYSGPPTTLVNPADVINLPDEFINPIIWSALRNLAYRERDWNALNEADRMYHQSITRAAATIGMTSADSSEVKRSGFFDNYDYPGII